MAWMKQPTKDELRKQLADALAVVDDQAQELVQLQHRIAVVEAAEAILKHRVATLKQQADALPWWVRAVMRWWRA